MGYAARFARPGVPLRAGQLCQVRLALVDPLSSTRALFPRTLTTGGRPRAA